MTRVNTPKRAKLLRYLHLLGIILFLSACSTQQVARTTVSIARLPAKAVGSAARATGSTVGGTVGYAVGGRIGGTVGATIGRTAGSIVTGNQ